MKTTLINFFLVGLCVNCVLSKHVKSVRPSYNTTTRYSTTIPDDRFNLHVSQCHFSDPNVTECIKNTAEQVRHLLAKGVPELNIQSLDPLNIPSLRMRQHKSPKQGFSFDIWLSDVTLKGLTNYNYNNVDVFPEEMKVVANVSLPEVNMTSEYVVIGQFQMLPIESVGILTANFSDCEANIVSLSARVHNRMVIKDVSVRLQCAGQTRTELVDSKSTTHHMELITDHMVTMHAGEIVRELQPAVETSLAMVLEDVANKFLKKISADSVMGTESEEGREREGEYSNPQN